MPRSWKERLIQTLQQLKADNQTLRAAVLGVGNEYRGDDALGVLVVRAMQERLPDRNNLLLLEAGTVPENYCGPLKRYSPHLILVVDAAQMGKAAGEIAWIETRQAGGICFSTHTLPLPLMLDYLASETGCLTAILGIQPADISFGAALSTGVQEAVQTLVDELIEALTALQPIEQQPNRNIQSEPDTGICR